MCSVQHRDKRSIGVEDVVFFFFFFFFFYFEIRLGSTDSEATECYSLLCWCILLVQITKRIKKKKGNATISFQLNDECFSCLQLTSLHSHLVFAFSIRPLQVWFYASVSKLESLPFSFQRRPRISPPGLTQIRSAWHGVRTARLESTARICSTSCIGARPIRLTVSRQGTPPCKAVRSCSTLTSPTPYRMSCQWKPATGTGTAVSVPNWVSSHFFCPDQSCQLQNKSMPRYFVIDMLLFTFIPKLVWICLLWICDRWAHCQIAISFLLHIVQYIILLCLLKKL